MEWAHRSGILCEVIFYHETCFVLQKETKIIKKQQYNNNNNNNKRTRSEVKLYQKLIEDFPRIKFELVVRSFNSDTSYPVNVMRNAAVSLVVTE
jgi:hypothetical protein